jgi:hypothetical protein
MMGGGLINGGPCSSGAAGATALRVRWSNSGGTAQVNYEAFGLPDHSREKVTAYPSSFNAGFTPQWGDPNFGGGVVLDDSDFVDIEISTKGLTTISSATIAILARSYATSSDGSFSWQTLAGVFSTNTDFVGNDAPYRWYAADLSSAITAGDGGLLIRVRAGPSSGTLAVNRLEICMSAN